MRASRKNNRAHLVGVRKTVNGAYQNRYAPFFVVGNALGSPSGRAVTAGD